MNSEVYQCCKHCLTVSTVVKLFFAVVNKVLGIAKKSHSVTIYSLPACRKATTRGIVTGSGNVGKFYSARRVITLK